MEVFDCKEMRRIVDLPRRPQEWSAEKTEEARDLLTKFLKKPGGTMRLNAIQARALVEAHDVGRLVGLMSAGAGKTLFSALVGKLLTSKRILILVPAQLRIKTMEDFTRLSEHFVFPTPFLADSPSTLGPDDPIIRVLAYESLSSINYATWIEEFAPDLIIADEAHCLQSLKSGRSKRLFRYIRTTRRRGDKVTFIPLTATPWSKSIRQVAHLFEAALQELSPLPCEYNALEQWSLALDPNVKAELRLKPGALLRLSETKSEKLEDVRRAVRDRILQSAGVVASQETPCGIPLILQRRDIAVPATVRTAMKTFREDYRLPNGDICEAGVTYHNHARELVKGFAYAYEFPPPPEWRLAKSAWVSLTRSIIKGSRSLDTPLAVWRYVESGKMGKVPEFDEWVAIKDTFRPVTKPIWVDDFIVRDAEKWALETGGIVWVQHSTAHTDEPDDDAVGGLFKSIPYFGGGDERIKSYKGPCAASVNAHGTGKNLTQWDKALIMGMPSGGKKLEQLLARLHREGQRSDTVTFYFYCPSLEEVNAIKTATTDAEYIEATSGMPQRILNAHWLEPDGTGFYPDEYMTRQDQSDPMWWKE